MFIFITALVSALVGVSPLILRGHMKKAVWLAALSGVVLWGIYYVMTPSTVWPMFGIPGFFTGVLLVVSAIMVGFADGKPHDDPTAFKGSYAIAIPVLFWLAWFGTCIAGWSAFYAQTYANMLGAVEEREWTQDVQPKDPHHMRWVSYENALYIAKKAVGTAGSIGSQFELDGGHMALQRVNGSLVYAIPFEYAGFTPWLYTDGTPGFMVVSAEDPEHAARFIKLPAGKEMKCMPGAYFGNYLERHLRNSGFLNDGLETPRFELDDSERPWWVITTYRPTVWWYGEKVTGVAIVDPSTCEVTRYAPENIPAWVDRVVPASFIENYVAWHGLYSGGWPNSWWGKFNLTEPAKPLLIYSATDRAEWVMGITSTNNADDSLISITYADSRTGKAVNYRVQGGGATEDAVVSAVNANSQVKFRHLHATDAQIYNIYGTMAAVAPLLNENNAFQGAAVVPITNVQDVAVGTTQMEALRNYQALLSRRGQQLEFDKGAITQKATGVVARIRQDVSPNGSVYYILLKDGAHVFTASSQDHAMLPMTQEGDTVTIEYVAGEETVVPLQTFRNDTLGELKKLASPAR